MAAHGLGDHVFSKALRVDLLAGGLEFVNQLEDKPPGFRGLDNRGQGIEQEGLLAKFTEPARLKGG